MADRERAARRAWRDGRSSSVAAQVRADIDGELALDNLERETLGAYDAVQP
jgi:hypothetical protein